MKPISYYAFKDTESGNLNRCSQESDAAPLIVNCAGTFTSEYPFTTDNLKGRLDWYLMHVTSGELAVRFPDGERRVRAGETVIFPPKYKYYYRYCEKSEPLNYLWAHFTGSAAELYLDQLGFSPLPAVFSSSPESHANMNFRALFDIFSKEDQIRVHALAATFLQILVALSPYNTKEKERRAITRSLRYINDFYTEDIRIPDLAAMENLSNSRYHAVFKEAMGMSPSAYVTELRMRHACELLRTTDMSVKQIGSLVGYRDPHFFSKAFKLSVGASPAEYRRS